MAATGISELASMMHTFGAQEFSTPLCSVLSTWADLAESGPGGKSSAFAIHARAAARHIKALEDVASAASALLELDKTDPGAKRELGTALDALNASLSELASRDH